MEVLLSRAATARATAATLPFALDRHRILHAFPDSEALLTGPLSEPLAEVLRTMGVAQAETIATAALEMVMSRQATWIAVRHRPTRAEVGTYISLVRQMASL